MRTFEKRTDERLTRLERSTLSGSVDRAIFTLSGSLVTRSDSLSGTINARFASLSSSDNTALSGTINAKFISLSGTINARFVSMTSYVDSQIAAHSGTINSAFVSLSGTINSAVKHLDDVKQAADGTLTAIAALTSNGLVELTSAGEAATVRTIGVGAGTSIPSTADADARYLGINSGSAAIEAMRYTQIPGFQAGNGTTSGKSLGSTQNQLYYYGRAPRNWVSGTVVTVTNRCIAAGSGFTWAELAICTGSFVRGGAPTIWVVGYANIISKLTGTTVDYIDVPIMKPGGILAGEDIWLLWGKLSTGSPALQCSTFTENIIIGVNCLMTASWQPSTFVNTNTFVTVPTSQTTALLWAVLNYP